MLPLTRRSLPQISRRVTVALATVTLCAVALPTLYLSRVPQASAEPPKPEAAPAVSERKTTVVVPAAVPQTPTPAATPPYGVQSGVTYISAEPSRVRAPSVEFLPPLSETEKKITAALDKSTDFEFAETSLTDAIDYLRSKHELEIQIDEQGLQSEAIDPSTPIKASIKGISLRSALRLLLKPYDLTYIVADEVLLITGQSRADDLLITRTYPVGDFLEKMDGDEGERFIKTFTTTIDPASWNTSGGKGDLAVVPRSKSLVITQSYPVHEKVLQLLRSLREARDLDGKSSAVERPSATITPAGVPKSFAAEVYVVQSEGEPAVHVTPKLTGPKQLNEGETGRFTFTVTNTGREVAHDVQVVVTPTEFLVTAATEGYVWKEGNGPYLEWRVPEIEVGKEVRFELEGHGKASTTLRGRITVYVEPNGATPELAKHDFEYTHAGGDSKPRDEQPVITPIPVGTLAPPAAPARLAPGIAQTMTLGRGILPKLTGPATLQLGETGKFTIEVANTSGEPVSDVRVAMRLASQLRPTMATAGFAWDSDLAPGAIAEGAQQTGTVAVDRAPAGEMLVWDVATIEAGKNVRFEVQFQAATEVEKGVSEVLVAPRGGEQTLTQATIEVAAGVASAPRY